ncbi:LCP family protein [Streptomyces sp. B3I8]|uniref:LCP family protein n=1 Tax=Streptomyces sp. B3I8 TaxID=3042303 RepID=UPI00278A14F0|nr:LCP family protein [Streptomyces sp. B3I8]MDQ0786946.1 anionic cell wall polymer biosynthesis LytR-Cps2A-Psr (LCP) family protein [Streptomyces sp. B3I8]
MNDRYDGYPAGDQYEIVGYDEFGQPVYRQVPAPRAPEGYDPYDPYAGGPPQQQQGYADQSGQAAGTGYPGYGYDPYAAAQQPAPPYDDTAGAGGAAGASPYGAYDPYGTTGSAPGAPEDPYGQTSGGQRSRVTGRTARIPQQSGPADQAAYETPGGTEHAPGTGAGTAAGSGMGTATGSGTGPDSDGDADREYRTEQFAFVEEPDGDSEDVIDWLAFTENRTERREEAKRRARSRVVALVVALAVVAVGGVGYLWYAGELPGGSSGGGAAGTTTAAGAQSRDVVVVHLHNTKGGGTSTALLVDNTTTKRGATVLLPNSLALTDEDGSTTTLAKSVDDDGSSGTREELDTVLGTDIEGTWRLDTPYLNNLVELVGNIEIDTDADVPDPADKKKDAGPLVHKGSSQTLSGKMAVAYATYRASGESQDAQLKRFGQVMQGVLRKLSSDAGAATTTVRTLAQILDPSLSDKDLGAFLAKLAAHAKEGDYTTDLVPVGPDGSVDDTASDGVVKKLLGGTVKSPGAGDAVRVGIKNATGDKDDTEKARVTLVNGGYTFLDAGTTTGVATSAVTYKDTAHKDDAVEVAKTLGLSAGAVTKGTVASGADVSVVLGQDYHPSS